jgi:hypothetical protein
MITARVGFGKSYNNRKEFRLKAGSRQMPALLVLLDRHQVEPA